MRSRLPHRIQVMENASDWSQLDLPASGREEQPRWIRMAITAAQRFASDRSQWQMPRESARTGLAYSETFLEYFPSSQWFLTLGFHEKGEMRLHLIVLSGKSMEEKSLFKPPFPHWRHAVTRKSWTWACVAYFCCRSGWNICSSWQGPFTYPWFSLQISAQWRNCTAAAQGQNLQILPASPFLVHFLPFYEVGGMMWSLLLTFKYMIWWVISEKHPK